LSHRKEEEGPTKFHSISCHGKKGKLNVLIRKKERPICPSGGGGGGGKGFHRAGIGHLCQHEVTTTRMKKGGGGGKTFSPLQKEKGNLQSI